MNTDDLVKIKYSEEGYLPSLPPHLISNEEMCDAFLHNEISYFYMNYPLLEESLNEEYQTLVGSIEYHISNFLKLINPTPLPNWVYSYMLGVTVNNMSPQADRHYLLSGLHCDVIDDMMTPLSQYNCYQLSKQYVNKLRADEKKVLVDDQWVITRPPTMFGEPHVIKMIRINGAY